MALKFKNINVSCPRDYARTRSMEIQYAQLEDGVLFPAPCNGCSFYSGCNICLKCTASITLMFYHNQELFNSYETVTPDFSYIQSKK